MKDDTFFWVSFRMMHLRQQQSRRALRDEHKSIDTIQWPTRLTKPIQRLFVHLWA
jgi:hypothetical protein